MTNQQHPITPPPELVEQWLRERPENEFAHSYITTQAARWGADQQLKLDAEQINEAWQKGANAELEACCEWAAEVDRDLDKELRAARRPKPPSLKVRIAEAIAKGNKHDALSLLDEALPDD